MDTPTGPGPADCGPRIEIPPGVKLGDVVAEVPKGDESHEMCPFSWMAVMQQVHGLVGGKAVTQTVLGPSSFGCFRERCAVWIAEGGLHGMCSFKAVGQAALAALGHLTKPTVPFGAAPAEPVRSL